MTDLILGIDGGGTKTRAECYDALGFRFLSAGEDGACNIAAVPIDAALASVTAASNAAGIEFFTIRAVCAAVAGYSHEARRREFQTGLRSLFPNALVSVAPDYVAAFHSALPEGSGVMVIAGTGSIAFARNGGGDGRSARAGGYGYLIDDAGSGYGVGRQALAAILAAQDGTGEATVLGDFVTSHLGWMDAEPGRIVAEVYFGSLDRARIASLAEVVAEAAGAGDAVARHILMRAGGALARLAEAAMRGAFGEMTQSIPLARTGSLWLAGPALTDVFERSTLRFAPSAILVSPSDHNPAWGAARMAADLLLQANKA